MAWSALVAGSGAEQGKVPGLLLSGRKQGSLPRLPPPMGRAWRLWVGLVPSTGWGPAQGASWERAVRVHFPYSLFTQLARGMTADIASSGCLLLKS